MEQLQAKALRGARLFFSSTVAIGAVTVALGDRPHSSALKPVAAADGC
jgi:hypothetical protein